jgi:hypothetical protein
LKTQCFFWHLNIGFIGFDIRECALVICDLLWNLASMMVFPSDCYLIVGERWQLGERFSFRGEYPRGSLVGIY